MLCTPCDCSWRSIPLGTLPSWLYKRHFIAYHTSLFGITTITSNVARVLSVISIPETTHVLVHVCQEISLSPFLFVVFNAPKPVSYILLYSLTMWIWKN